MVIISTASRAAIERVIIPDLDRVSGHHRAGGAIYIYIYIYIYNIHQVAIERVFGTSYTGTGLPAADRAAAAELFEQVAQLSMCGPRQL